MKLQMMAGKKSSKHSFDKDDSNKPVNSRRTDDVEEYDTDAFAQFHHLSVTYFMGPMVQNTIYEVRLVHANL